MDIERLVNEDGKELVLIFEYHGEEDLEEIKEHWMAIMGNPAHSFVAGVKNVLEGWER